MNKSLEKTFQEVTRLALTCIKTLSIEIERKIQK